jgi:CelD/BcsL family acetyltransferase involved in cellulose biosynthesis
MTAVEIKVLRELAEFAAIREQWNSLYARSPTASSSLRFEWLSEWWRVYGHVYGADGGGLAIVTAWTDGDLVGAIPLYRRVEGRFLRHARLQFLSTGEAEFEETCPEYMDVLALPGTESQVIAALEATLRSPLMPRWDDLMFMDVAEHSAVSAFWASGTRGRTVLNEARGSCPIADLDGGFDAYLGRLSANSRQHSRRTLREANRVGATLELARTAQEADDWFDELIELHQDRWRSLGQPGCFAASRFTAFHRALAQQLVPQNAAVLARLSIGGKPLAVLYGFVSGRKFDFYQSGIKPDGCAGLARPGIAAHLLLMAHLADRGVTQYDFLRGTAEYKQRLATSAQPLVRLRIVRHTIRSALWTTAGMARRALGKLSRAFVRRDPSGIGLALWHSTAMFVGVAG